MRRLFERLVDRHRRRQIGAEIVDAYRRRPQTEGDLAGLDAATRALVEEEPWERFNGGRDVLGRD